MRQRLMRMAAQLILPSGYFDAAAVVAQPASNRNQATLESLLYPFSILFVLYPYP